MSPAEFFHFLSEFLPSGSSHRSPYRNGKRYHHWRFVIGGLTIREVIVQQKGRLWVHDGDLRLSINLASRPFGAFDQFEWHEQPSDAALVAIVLRLR